MVSELISTQYRKILSRFFNSQLEGFKQAFANPVTFILTMLVLTLALMLPTWLYLAKKSLNNPIDQIRQSSQITMFLKLEVTEEKASALADELRGLAEIKNVNYVAKTQALELFKRESGLGEQIEVLGDNPLPATLFIEINDISSVEKVKEVMAHLAKLPQSALVTMDLYWANKLQAVLDVGGRIFWFLVIMFAMAFVLTVFFAVKTVVQEHYEEISLTLILGATHGYIKRKFVQLGLWLGLLAAISAVIITNLAVLWLQQPVSEFAAEFAVKPQIQILDFTESMLLIVTGTLAAVLTAWFTTSFFLLKTEKQLHS